MKTASVKEIRNELEMATSQELLQHCLRLIKFKKENKELLTYLLFEARDEPAYVASVKTILDEIFATVNTRNAYLAKKTLRKIIRTAGRYIKYSNADTTEAELLIHICEKIRSTDLNLKKNTAVNNLYLSLLKKINKSVSALHEDIQHDYLKMLERIA